MWLISALSLHFHGNREKSTRTCRELRAVHLKPTLRCGHTPVEGRVVAKTLGGVRFLTWSAKKLRLPVDKQINLRVLRLGCYWFLALTPCSNGFTSQPCVIQYSTTIVSSKHTWERCNPKYEATAGIRTQVAAAVPGIAMLALKGKPTAQGKNALRRKQLCREPTIATTAPTTIHGQLLAKAVCKNRMCRTQFTTPRHAAKTLSLR